MSWTEKPRVGVVLTVARRVAEPPIKRNTTTPLSAHRHRSSILSQPTEEANLSLYRIVSPSYLEPCAQCLIDLPRSQRTTAEAPLYENSPKGTISSANEWNQHVGVGKLVSWVAVEGIENLLCSIETCSMIRIRELLLLPLG